MRRNLSSLLHSCCKVLQVNTRVAKILIGVFELKIHDEQHNKWYIVNNVLQYLFSSCSCSCLNSWRFAYHKVIKQNGLLDLECVATDSALCFFSSRSCKNTKKKHLLHYVSCTILLYGYFLYVLYFSRTCMIESRKQTCNWIQDWLHFWLHFCSERPLGYFRHLNVPLNARFSW